MNFLGLDLSLTNTGWCVINVDSGRVKVKRYGIIQPKKLRDMERLIFIENKIRVICLTWKFQAVGLEGYALGSRTGKAMDRGELGGIVKRYINAVGLSLHIFPPKRLKKFVSGNGNADKDKMVKCVLANSGCLFKRIQASRLNDVADAYGVAYMAGVKSGNIVVASWRRELLEG